MLGYAHERIRDVGAAATVAGASFPRRRCRRPDPRADPGGRVPARASTWSRPRSPSSSTSAADRCARRSSSCGPRDCCNEEPRRGTFVVSLTADDVREIYGLRAALEGRAARLIARAAGPRDDRAAAHPRRRDRRGRRHGGRRRGVARRSGVPRRALRGCAATPGSSRCSIATCPTLRALLRLDERVLRSLDEVSNQHRPFVEAIEAGEEETAARLLAEHAEHAGELIAGVVAANEAAAD